MSISMRREDTPLIFQLPLCQKLLECSRNQSPDLAQYRQINKINQKAAACAICYGYYWNYVLEDLDKEKCLDY
jgi:hypothetical protein